MIIVIICLVLHLSAKSHAEEGVLGSLLVLLVLMLLLFPCAWCILVPSSGHYTRKFGHATFTKVILNLQILTNTNAIGSTNTVPA